jgi:ABC-2 type transport system permease protein
MFRLLKIEWLKIKTYRTFWVLFLAYVILFPIGYLLSASQWMSERGGNTEEAVLRGLLGSPFIFPNTWLSAGWFSGLMFVIIGMLFILLITNEVQYRTHRQNIIDGWSRTDFLAAKGLVMLALVLISTLLVVICGFFVGQQYTPSGGSGVLEEFHRVGYYALMSLHYLMAAFVVAILIKRTGLAIIIYFALVIIVDNVLWLIFYSKDSQLAYFMPLECTDSLVPNPFKPRSFEHRTVSDSALILTSVAYMAVFGYIILNRFKNSDLKT